MASSNGATKIGINGPGMIGRNLIRMFVDHPEFGVRVAAINYHNPEIDKIVYLLKYCSIYGSWSKEVLPKKDGILIGKDKINFFAENDAIEIPWDKMGIDLVIDSSRVYNDPLKALEHFHHNHIKNVIITSSPKNNQCKIVVFGVNHKEINPRDDKVISSATCSSNCLVTTVDILDKAFKVKSLFALTTHSQTGENELYDKVSSGIEGRAIADNIVPSQTGATKTFFKVMPHLESQLGNRISIKANRVPVSTGSVFDITVKVRKSTKLREVISVFKEAESGSMKDVIKVVDDSITVSDVRGLMHAAVIPTPYIEVLNNGKIILLKAFYDNIRGFNSQIGRLVKYLAG